MWGQKHRDIANMQLWTLTIFFFFNIIHFHIREFFDNRLTEIWSIQYQRSLRYQKIQSSQVLCTDTPFLKTPQLCKDERCLRIWIIIGQLKYACNHNRDMRLKDKEPCSKNKGCSKAEVVFVCLIFIIVDTTLTNLVPNSSLGGSKPHCPRTGALSKRLD